MGDATAAVAASGVQALIISDPSGFKGHGAGSEPGFARKFGPCIQAFIENRSKEPPCN